MDTPNYSEMARIQRGLEDFLEQELDIAKTTQAVSNSRNSKSDSRNTRSGSSKSSSKPEGKKSKTRTTAKKPKAKVSAQGTKPDTPQPHNPKKKGKKKSRLRRFLFAAVLIIALLGAGLYCLAGSLYGKMNYAEIVSQTDLPLQENGVVNILLIGTDSRQNDASGRSDAMILLSISSKTKAIYLTSLLRDMYVEIPGHDGNRLNAAYAFGGAELLMETIEQNFGIPVHRYMVVNFEGFASLVDAVGGVDLELTSAEIEYVNGYLVEYNMLTGRPQGTDNMDPSASGLVHLNGPQSLAYSRNRYIGTDFGRTERQRKVLTAVMKKLPSSLLTNFNGLTEGLMPNLTTNLTQGECFRLSLMAGKLLTYDITADSIPQSGTYRNATIRQMAVLEVDFDTNIQYLREKLYGE